MAQPNQRPGGEDFQERAVAWGLGLNFAYGVIGFFLVGWAVQAWVWKDAAPWPMLAGLGLGLVGGGYRFVRDGLAMNRK